MKNKQELLTWLEINCSESPSLNEAQAVINDSQFHILIKYSEAQWISYITAKHLAGAIFNELHSTEVPPVTSRETAFAMLKALNPRSNPNSKIFSRMMDVGFIAWQSVLHAIQINDSDLLLQCYDKAKSDVGTRTKTRLEKNNKIEIITRMESNSKACLIEARQKGTDMRFVVKVIKEKNSIEEQIVGALDLCQWRDEGTHVVPYFLDLLKNDEGVVDTPTDVESNATVCAVVSPKYLSTLDGFSDCNDDIAYKQGCMLVDALNRIHENGKVHMDIKSGNVFRDYDQRWFIGDYGSCVAIDSTIDSCSDNFYYKRFMNDNKDHPATYFHDWFMLGITLLCAVSSEACEIVSAGGFSKETLIAFLSQLKSSEVTGLVGDLTKCEKQIYKY